MGQPPRLLQIFLPDEQPIICFVTMIVQNRASVLANPVAFQAVEATLAGIQRWNVLAGVVLPDHVHLLVMPTRNRAMAVSDFSTAFKRLLHKRLPNQRWQWQRGCFDRLLRSGETLQN